MSIKLEKSLRSKNPAIEAILEIGEKLEQWIKEPEPGIDFQFLQTYTQYGWETKSLSSFLWHPCLALKTCSEKSNLLRQMKMLLFRPLWLC